MTRHATAKSTRVARRRPRELHRAVPTAAAARFELCLARLVAVRDGQASVELDGATCDALSTVRLEPALVGRTVTVAFLEGDPARPVVLGVVGGAAAVPVARVDGERVVLEANRELELRCGKASIHLTADGRVTIRGADVVSRSSGLNRIKGAAVRIN